MMCAIKRKEIVYDGQDEDRNEGGFVGKKEDDEENNVVEHHELNVAIMPLQAVAVINR